MNILQNKIRIVLFYNLSMCSLKLLGYVLYGGLDFRFICLIFTLVDGQSLSIVEDLSANAAASAPGQENEHSSSEHLDSGKKSDASEPVNLSLQPAGSTSSTSEHPGAGLVSSRPGLSPSSSMGSLSSEKSTLNPHAKVYYLLCSSHSLVVYPFNLILSSLACPCFSLFDFHILYCK